MTKVQCFFSVHKNKRILDWIYKNGIKKVLRWEILSRRLEKGIKITSSTTATTSFFQSIEKNKFNFILSLINLKMKNYNLPNWIIFNDSFHHVSCLKKNKKINIYIKK